MHTLFQRLRRVFDLPDAGSDVVIGSERRGYLYCSALGSILRGYEEMRVLDGKKNGEDSEECC
jgi:hypothetical protein